MRPVDLVCIMILSSWQQRFGWFGGGVRGYLGRAGDNIDMGAEREGMSRNRPRLDLDQATANGDVKELGFGECGL